MLTMRVRGVCCRTNLPSITAFRGFGSPQPMMVVENWMHGAAVILGLDPAQIRERNLYEDGDVTY